MIDNYIIALKPSYAAGRGMFVCIGHKGYTNVIMAAGRFSMAEAHDCVSLNPDKYVAIQLDPNVEPDCEWIRAFDGNYNLSCVNEYHGRGRHDALTMNPPYTRCPFCGGTIRLCEEQE